MVAKAWKEISAEEREKWENMARDDRTRYEIEKSMYQGEWQVPNQRRKKDPTAPKRPATAFLAFANSHRGKVKKEMQNISNGELSKVLASRWRSAPQEFRQRYIDEEQQKRKEYNFAITEWRKINQEKKYQEKMQREERVRHLVDQLKDGTTNVDYDGSAIIDNNDADGMEVDNDRPPVHARLWATEGTHEHIPHRESRHDS